MVHVAVAVIERIASSGGRELLIAKRSKDAHQGGLWEFPGGKVEVGESVTEALARELFEELDVVIQPLGGEQLLRDGLVPLIQIEHDYGDKCVLLDVWRVSRFEGNVEGKEGQPIQWVPEDELSQYQFPIANQAIIKACRLPEYYVITPAYSSLQEAEKAMAILLEVECSLVLFRQPQLDEVTYREYAEHLLHRFPAQARKLLLSGDVGLSNVGARGVHLPFRCAKSLKNRPISTSQLLVVSCHSAREIEHAERIGADFVTLSPVQFTHSHPETETLGWEEFKSLARRATMPVFAQGGLRKSDLHASWCNGAQGISGIRLWQSESHNVE